MIQIPSPFPNLLVLLTQKGCKRNRGSVRTCSISWKNSFFHPAAFLASAALCRIQIQSPPSWLWLVTLFYHSLMLVLIPSYLLDIRHNLLLQRSSKFMAVLTKTYSLYSKWLLEWNLWWQNTSLTIHLQPQIIANGGKTKKRRSTPTFCHFIILILPYKDLNASPVTKCITSFHCSWQWQTKGKTLQGVFALKWHILIYYNK